ncbi:branched-chain amino acid ABC transporter permease [Candidatus Liberibacter brunswickensis]|uniref:branched-chain amino acid ABC transporter permease n=1 Tax=Candidatus Liberibacter brunswickensis TaxID=1968796 RepID=UPI002FE1823B
MAAIYPIVIFSFFGASKAQYYIGNIGIRILIYVIMAWGLSIVVGSLALLSLNSVIAYAVGAYSYVILGRFYGISPILLVPLSAIISGIIGIVLALPSLRFRGDYLAILTLIMSAVFHDILIKWKAVTNGKVGLYVSDSILFLGVDLKSLVGFFRYNPSGVFYKIFMYYVLLLVCFFSVWIILWLRRKSISNAWRTIRDNQKAFFSFNSAIIFAKLSAFAVSSMFAGIAGAFLVASGSTRIVSPDMFKMSESITVLSLVILGGMTSLSKIARTVIIIVGGIEIFCGSKLYYLNSFLKFDCSFSSRSTALMIASLFLVILLKSHSLLKLRNPSPFTDLRK